MPRSISNSKVEDFEPRKKNPIGLLDDSNIDEHLKSLKIGDKNTPLQISSEELKIASDLSVDGNLVSRMITTETDFTLRSLGDINFEAHGADINFIIGDITMLNYNLYGTMTMYNLLDQGEYFQIEVGVGGVTKLVTASDTASGDLRLEPDGDVLIFPATDTKVKIDHNTTKTTTASQYGFVIDCDATGIVASGQTLTHTGIDLDLNCDLSLIHI